MSVSNRQLFVAKQGVKYAASLTSATAETATSPGDLREGAIGVFYKTSTGTWALCAYGDTSTYTTHGRFIIAQGTAGQPIVSSMIDAKYVQAYLGRVYSAPVKQVVHLFYDGTTGNGLTTVTDGGTYTIGLKKTSKQQYPYIPRMSTSIVASTGSTQYSIISQLITAMNSKVSETSTTGSGANYWSMLGEVVGNGTNTAITASTTGSVTVLDVAAGTPTVTGSVANGSTTLTYALSASTFSASGQGVAAGDYVAIGGIIYKITAVDYTTDTAYFVITLDRPYTGTTLSAAAASNFKHYSAVPTYFGIKLTGDVAGQKHEVSLSGVCEGETIIYTTNPSLGVGTVAEIQDAEKKSNLMSRAYYHPGAPFPEPPTSLVQSGETYDVATITFSVVQQDATDFTSTVGFPVHLQIAMSHTDITDTTLPSGALFASAGILNEIMLAAPGQFPKLTTI